MKLMNTLALRHLKQNKKQSLSAFLAITLAVSMLIAVSTFCFSVYDSVVEFAKAHDSANTMSSSLSGLITVGVLLGLVIVGAAILVISNAFNIQASERIKQFGILKSVGATEEQIKSTVTAESNWLSLIGIPAGIIFGHLLCFLAILLLNSNVSNDATGVAAMQYKLHFNIFAILIAAALGYASVRFASSLIARKVSKLSAIEAIRQTGEVKIESGKLKTSKMVDKLFGFEGSLASKQLKRNKRKFRVTIISLVTSIVLFMGAFSFGDTLIKTAMGAFADTGANVVLEPLGNSADFSKFDEYAKMLKSQHPEKMSIFYSYRYMPNEGKANEGIGDWYNLIAMNDKDYNAYCKQAGVPSGSNMLLTQSNVDKSVPFDITLPDLNDANIPVTNQVNITNPYLKSITMVYEPNIIMPRSELQKLGVTIEAHYYIITDDATNFIDKIKPRSEEFGFDKVYYHNTEEYTRELQQLYAMLMSFVYCFIGMLALIGATSVLATINSNINLRKSEFATLRAVGMDSKKLHRMLNLESLFYGTRSLIYGLPIGLVLSYGMYKLSISNGLRLAPGRLSAEDIAKFPYELPYVGIIICVIGVFAICFISMYFATNRIRRSNIAESMRELNC